MEYREYKRNRGEQAEWEIGLDAVSGRVEWDTIAEYYVHLGDNYSERISAFAEAAKKSCERSFGLHSHVKAGLAVAAGRQTVMEDCLAIVVW